MEQGVIGQKATFTLTRSLTCEGRIVDKISMLNKAPKEEKEYNTVNNSNSDFVVVTGYLIQDADGRLHSIQYWRIQKIEPFAQVRPFDDGAPRRDLKGGYKRPE